MLPSKKDISESSPPFLMKFPSGEWSLVTEIINENNNQKLVIVYLKDDQLKQRYYVVSEPLFYVGADVWEAEYGAVLMTLNHQTLYDHPANRLWQKWNEYEKKT